VTTTLEKLERERNSPESPMPEPGVSPSMLSKQAAAAEAQLEDYNACYPSPPPEASGEDF